MSDSPSVPQPSTPGASDFEVRLAAFIGPRWESSYRRKLRVFLDDPAFVPTWNWSAALATPYWFLYRKMYLWFAVFFFVPSLVLEWLVPGASMLTPEAVRDPANQQMVLMLAAVHVSVRIAAGGVANWLLFRRARTAIRVVGMQPLSAGDSLQLLQRIGGTSRALTFGLLALLTIIGLAQLAGMLGTP